MERDSTESYIGGSIEEMCTSLLRGDLGQELASCLFFFFLNVAHFKNLY